LRSFRFPTGPDCFRHYEMVLEGNIALVPDEPSLRGVMDGLPVFFFGGAPVIDACCGTSLSSVLRYSERNHSEARYPPILPQGLAGALLHRSSAIVPDIARRVSNPAPGVAHVTPLCRILVAGQDGAWGSLTCSRLLEMAESVQAKIREGKEGGGGLQFEKLTHGFWRRYIRREVLGAGGNATTDSKSLERASPLEEGDQSSEPAPVCRQYSLEADRLAPRLGFLS